MAEGTWIIKTVEAGVVCEKMKYFVPGKGSADRVMKKMASKLKKEDQNKIACTRQLARLLNANFTAGDLLIGLDYSGEGMDKLYRYLRKKGIDTDSTQDPVQKADMLRIAAAHELDCLIRRVSRLLKKGGMELKYVAITSDMDGDTGELVRVHHHLVVPGYAKEAFLEKWTLGSVDYEPLWAGQKDRTPIAEYFIRQVRRIPDANKYTSSRNLRRPVPKLRIANTGAELRVPKGGTLLYRSEFCPGNPQYIRYIKAEKRPPAIDE